MRALKRSPTKPNYPRIRLKKSPTGSTRCPLTDNHDRPKVGKRPMESAEKNRDEHFQKLLDKFSQSAAAHKAQRAKLKRTVYETLASAYVVLVYYAKHPERAEELKDQCKANGINVTKATDLPLALIRWRYPPPTRNPERHRKTVSRWAAVLRQAIHDQIPAGDLARWLKMPGRGVDAMARKYARRLGGKKALVVRSAAPGEPTSTSNREDDNARQNTQGHGTERKDYEAAIPDKILGNTNRSGTVTGQENENNPDEEKVLWVVWNNATYQKWKATPGAVFNIKAKNTGDNSAYFMECELELPNEPSVQKADD